MSFETYDSNSSHLLEAILKQLQELNTHLTEMRKTLDSIDDNTMSEGKRKQQEALRQSSRSRW